jgi:putative tryptophan/tyrosine transport system substrate-binding protein
MARHIGRRKFLATLGAAAAAWPLAAHAQQPASTVRRVGFLLPGVARTPAVRGLLEAFRQGLKEYGWIEGQNIIVEYRFAEGKEDALPTIASELARLRLDVIVAEGTAAIQAAKTVAQTVPIVMATSSDPVGTGLVGSLSRPGGNITLESPEHGAKRQAAATLDRDCSRSGTGGHFVESLKSEHGRGAGADESGSTIFWH